MASSLVVEVPQTESSIRLNQIRFIEPSHCSFYWAPEQVTVTSVEETDLMGHNPGPTIAFLSHGS